MSRWVNFLLCFVIILDIGSQAHILKNHDQEPSEPSNEEKNEGPKKSPLRPSKIYSFLLTLQNMIEDLLPEPSNGNVIYVYRFKNYRFSNDVGENIRFWKKEFILWNKYWWHTLFEIFIFCPNSTLIYREDCRFFLGWKTRENVVVLGFLAVDNFDFTRKIVQKKIG